ncbi:52 kDa repressor of the inhibitor of the protein kinase-like [Ochlerotatus camptorhynchus]|uniref:52 kDa repressor of the inhibitor of the protein kinase-like n=1 Tax=Ochlerotatus camptorhynchus TaxID=644619 RepID=UPI0031DB16B5
MERTLAENKELIDVELQSEIDVEKQKWRDILERLIHCIKFLATQNLALRGHRESLQSDDASNVGNFLGLLKLLAAFDPVMQAHLKNAKNRPGSTSYLSAATQNEFIHLMASTVRENMLETIRQAKYFGIMFDPTPDQAHREQVSEVVRYVDVDFTKKTVRVAESFLGFIQINLKDAESLVGTILSQLEKDGMDLQDCRSQCYDNAAVMAGHKSGVQQRIIEKNHLAVFVNCDNHSLNLIGVNAAKQDVMMVTFFGTIQALYVFFSSSTQRWEKLKIAVPKVVKSESTTRWSARVEAVKPINNHLDEILQVLQAMIDGATETTDTRSEARQLYNRMLTPEFLTLLGFWTNVLLPIDRVQKRLQDPAMNFHDAALDLESLRDHFYNERERLVSKALEVGLNLCQEWEVETERRPRRKKTMAGETSKDAGLKTTQETERAMKETIDRLHTEMDDRFTRLHDTDAKFGFLLDVEGLCTGISRDILKTKCENFGQTYNRDVDGEQYEEILDFRMMISTRTNVKLTRPEDVLLFIVQYGDESVFPNLRIAIQILLTIAV